MKLESTLLRRSGFLHVAPILDVVLLLLIFFLLGSSFTLQSGVAVEVPESRAILRPMAAAHVITVPAVASGPAAAPAAGGVELYFNERRVRLTDLADVLEAARGESANVVVRADRLSPYGLVFEISNIALELGYQVAFATAPVEGP